MIKKFKVPLTFVLIFFLSLQVIIDSDFGWHLRVGEYIYQTMSIPKHDIISFSLPDYPYVYHSWLGELITYLSHQLFGLWGISILFALVTTVAFFFIYKSSLLESGGKISYFLLLWSAFASYTLTGRGMRAFGFLFLSIVYFLFLKYRINKSPLIWLTLPVFLLWANFHGSFTIGILILIVITTVHLLTKKPADKTKELKFFLSIIGLSTIATLINPYGLRAWQQALQMSANSIFSIVNSDWQPLTQNNPFAWTLVIIILTFLALPRLFQVKTDKFTQIMATISLILTLLTARFVFVLLVIFIPLANQLLCLLSSKIGTLNFRALPAKFSIIASYVILILIIFQNLVEINFAYKNLPNYSQFLSAKFQGELGFNIWPYQASRSIAQNNLGGRRFLTESAYSGFLLLQYPDLKIFFYGAMDNFLVNGRSFAFEYLDLVRVAPGWEEKLEKYQIEAVFLPPSFPLVTVLKLKPNWQTVYQDKQAVILIKI